MEEVLDIICETALDEANLLLSTHAESNVPLTELSDLISEQINTYTYELLDYLEDYHLSPSDPLIENYLNYCPKFLTENYKKRLLEDVPDIHKKAIIACFIASKMVYSRGLTWCPSIVDVLPLISRDEALHRKQF